MPQSGDHLTFHRVRSGRDVPESGSFVQTRGDQEFAVGGKAKIGYAVRMFVEALEFICGGRVPSLDEVGLVLGLLGTNAGGNLPSIGGECHVEEVIVWHYYFPKGGSSLRIKQAERVVRGAGEGLAILGCG